MFNLINWQQLWTNLFGNDVGWLGLDWGFWVSMGIVALVVIFQNVFFWCLKPKPEAKELIEMNKRFEKIAKENKKKHIED